MLRVVLYSLVGFGPEVIPRERPLDVPQPEFCAVELLWCRAGKVRAGRWPTVARKLGADDIAPSLGVFPAISMLDQIPLALALPNTTSRDEPSLGYR